LGRPVDLFTAVQGVFFVRKKALRVLLAVYGLSKDAIAVTPAGKEVLL
jgi:hypothetical protein